MKLRIKCFFKNFFVQMGRIEETQRSFYLDGCILCHIFQNESINENQNSRDDHLEETYKPNQLKWPF